MPNEPSMEEILSSIKRIIADEDRAGPRAPRRGAASAARPTAPEIDADDQILELTEVLPAETAGMDDEEVPVPPAAKPAKAPRADMRPARQRDAAPARSEAPAPVLSDISAKAARDSLESLSKMLVCSEDGQSNTLEGLVREMLRPMLKDWLDTHLPQMVEAMVKREIDRITGRV